MNSYRDIERGYVLVPDIKLGNQWAKVLEEIEEVKEEIGVEESGEMYFKRGGTLQNLVRELLDIKLATDNFINKLEDFYGKETIKMACGSWDEKIEYYKEVKYGEHNCNS
ncbi:MAG: hypothetical protein RR744_00470 [Cellulosilyticaceae bacterium]